MKRTLLAVLAMSMLVLAQACERTITQVVNDDQMAQNCFECHSDSNTGLVAAEQQWNNSLHASGFNVNRATRASCAPCHGSEGFIQSVNGEEVTGGNNPTVIHCFTCHAPHEQGDFSLRVKFPPLLANGVSLDMGTANTCVTCHQARRDVNTYVGTVDSTGTVTISSTHWGPHRSTQGDIIIGTNGYEYEGFTYETTNHSLAIVNGCVDCHKNLGTSNNVVGGHSFNMRWNLIDHDGLAEEILNTAACEGCHGDLDDFNFNDRQDEVVGLIHDLEALLETAGLYHDGHPVKGVTTSVDSAGALWNLLMVEEDRSRGVHNTRYSVSLLNSSIEFMEGTLPQSIGPRAVPALEE